MRKAVLIVSFVLLVIVTALSCRPMPSQHKASREAGTIVSQSTSSNQSFAFTFKVEQKLFTLTMTADKTTMSYLGKTYTNPDPTKYCKFGKTIECLFQKDRGILFLQRGNDELIVSVLNPSTTPKLTGDKVWVSKTEVVRQPGNTEITYRYACWFKSKDGKRIYEVVQEDVESKTIPCLFRNAVASFKEVK